jgi:hypothetical protein
VVTIERFIKFRFVGNLKKMTLEDLTRYETAGVAAANAEKDPGLALAAIGDFYKGILEEEGDPIITSALKDASVGIQAGSGISNSGVARAINIYGGKFLRTFDNTNVSDLTNYLSVGYTIPNKARSALELYSELTPEQLAEKAKEDGTSDKEKANLGKVIISLKMLKGRRLSMLGSDIVDRNTTEGLIDLFSEEED